MGNDGGSIPTRRELVKEAARNPSTTQMKETQKEQQEHYWTTCALSHQPLSLPIVSDCLGKLYNKDAVLEQLLATGNDPSESTKGLNNEELEIRLSSLRDVVEVKFQVDEDGVKDRAKSAPLRLVCPITNKALGPGVKAVYLVPCGHAFLESAVREMSGETCLQCNQVYSGNNVINILPTLAADTQRLKSREHKLREQGLTHSLKKSSMAGKKRKKNLASCEDKASISTQSQPSSATAVGSGGIKNADTASLTAKVLEEEQNHNKRRKMVKNDNLKGLFSSKNGMDEKHLDFMTRGFSIPAGAKR